MLHQMIDNTSTSHGFSGARGPLNQTKGALKRLLDRLDLIKIKFWQVRGTVLSRLGNF